jgi:hypothetical protein
MVQRFSLECQRESGGGDSKETRYELNKPAPAAEVSRETISIYNGRVYMRVAKHTYSALVAKHTYSPLVLVLSLGLMYSQVCSVICAFSNCSAPATFTRAATVEHTGHCHQEQPSSQKDQPSGDQHRCPAHGPAVSILPSVTISTVVSQFAWQTAGAELVSSVDILFVLSGTGTDHGGHFRSPPRRPLFTILRI